MLKENLELKKNSGSKTEDLELHCFLIFTEVKNMIKE